MATAAGYHHFETVPPREEEIRLELLPILRAIALGGLFLLAVALGVKIRIDPTSCCGGFVSGWGVWLVQVGGFAMTVGLAGAAVYHVSGMHVTRLLSDAGSSLLAGALVGALVLPSLPAVVQLGCLLDSRCRMPEGWSLLALPPVEHAGQVTLTLEGPWSLTTPTGRATCRSGWGSRTIDIIESSPAGTTGEDLTLDFRPGPDGRVARLDLVVEEPDGRTVFWTDPSGPQAFTAAPGSGRDRGSVSFADLPVERYPEPFAGGGGAIRGTLTWDCPSP